MRIKRNRTLSTFAGALFLMSLCLPACARNDETTSGTVTAATEQVGRTPTTIDSGATGEPSRSATAVSPDNVATTDVASAVITAAEATLYAGPGEEHEAVAIAFGGTTYPVTGISQDQLWWRLTCYDDAAVRIEACWVSTDPEVAMPTASTAMQIGSDIKPYIELTFNFLRAVQSGLTAAGSEQYLSRDLQAIVDAGRPLPSLLGIRDAFPSFVMTDFSEPQATATALVRVRFNFDSPSYAIIHLIQEQGQWQIDRVAAHNLVKSFSTDELMQAEDVIISYYQALAGDEPDSAFELLTTERQERTSPEALSLLTDGLERLTVSTLQPVRGSGDQVIYYVRLMAIPDRSSSAIRPQNWRDGDNARWLTLIKDEHGWRIAQIINSRVLTEIESWQRVNILPIDMTVDIPADWARAGLQWAWSPNSQGVPGIGVSWADLGGPGDDESLLPRNRRELSIRPVNLGWAQGRQYDFETTGGPGEGPIAAETHMIVRTGRRAYDFYATAPSIEELDDMRPILQRVVAAVSITDPQASAFNSVETSVNFLATLMRDATGASSSAYLSEELKAKAGNQSSLLTLLGADTLFKSFDATWLENPAAGQARVTATLNFADGAQELVFTVERDADDSWLITDIKPINRQSG